MPVWGPIERPVALGAFAIFALLIVVFLLRDASGFVRSPFHELVGHVGASGGFTLAASGTLLVLRRQRPDLLTIVFAGAAITVTAELAQGLAPNRGIQLQDFVIGFGGVLLAAVGIELVLRLCSLLVTLRLHMLAASIASVVLLGLLVTDLSPETLANAAPDGQTCPFTTIAGNGGRVVIGDSVEVANRCLQTNGGGLSLFGADGATSLTGESALVSSPLKDLVANVVQSERIVVRVAFVTDHFTDEVRSPGVLLVLRSNEAGELLQVRTRDKTAQVAGPTFIDSYRSLSYSQVLESNQRYELEVELTSSEMRTTLDGNLIATNSVSPEWVEALAASDAATDMTLYVGNSPGLTLPALAVIEWIEIET